MKLTAPAAAWLVGLALAHGWYDAAPSAVLFLAGAFLAAALLCAVARVNVWPAALIGLCLLGVWRYEIAEPPPPPPVESSAPVHLRGRIANDPESTATRVKFALEIESIARKTRAGAPEWAGQTERAGKVLVYARPESAPTRNREAPYFRYGDRLELSGTLQNPEPIEGFDYPAYLESKGIYAVFWPREITVREDGERQQGVAAQLGNLKDSAQAGIYDLRRRLARALDTALPPEEAALAQALLLGLRGQLPDAVSDNFRRAGVAHLLAISGLHLGILLLLTVGTLHRLLGRHTHAPLALAFGLIWLYVLTSGAPASAVRAAIMGSVYLAALGLGRPRESLLPALALSAVAMTVLEPRIVAQISFQLSFAAMAGIVLALPWLPPVDQAITGRMERAGRLGPAGGVALSWLASGIIVSTAATLTTFPLVAFHFKELPLLGIPTTILAAPLLPFALVSGLAAAFAGSIHPVIGQIVGLPASAPLTALLQLVEVMPKETIAIEWGGANWSRAWYAILLAVLALSESSAYRVLVMAWLRGQPDPPGSVAAQPVRTGSAGRYLTRITTVALVAAAAVYVLSRIAGGDGRLHVYFFDVGQGDSILIVTPGGHQTLIDGGPEFTGATRQLAGQLPPWDRSLDLVAATHLDTDHSRGLLRVMENYKVGTALVGTPDPDSPLYPQWQKVIQQGNHQRVNLAAGHSIRLEDGIILRTLHPPATPMRGPAWDSNNNSLVFQLVYDDISFLLTGDIEAEAERYLARTAPGLESDVLKAAHHGSKSSTTAQFLRAVNPSWAVISAGRDNQYGHPHPEVVGRLEAAVGDANIFNTASRGTIKFSTDGQRLWVETER